MSAQPHLHTLPPACGLRPWLGGMTLLAWASLALAQPTAPSGPAAGARAGVLRLALPTTLGAPWVDWDEQQPRDGVLVRLVRQLATAQGLKLELLPLPPARVRAALATGEVDAVCGTDPQHGLERERLDWSAPLFEYSELLVGHPGAARLDQWPDNAPDMVVGATQAQPVLALDGRVADGRLRREDALSTDRLVKKLTAQRHPYAVLDQPAASQWREQGAGIAAWALPLARLKLQCGLSRRAPVTAAAWNEALESARQSGQLALAARQAWLPGFAVVTSRSSELREATEAQLADLYLARRATLPGRPAPRLLMLGGTLRADAMRQLLRREPGDYAAQWSARQFGGRQRMPEEFDDPLLLRAALIDDPRALGVLPMWAVDASLRVLAFR